jgi:phage shock protein A
MAKHSKKRAKKRSEDRPRGWRVLCVTGDEVLFVRGDGSTATVPFGICACIGDGEPLACEVKEEEDVVTFSYLGEDVASIPRELMAVLHEVLSAANLWGPSAVLEDTERDILKFCRKPGKLNRIRTKASRATVHRRAATLGKAGLIGVVGAGTYQTTSLGTQALEGAAAEQEAASGQEGAGSMRNEFSQSVALRELRGLKEVCDENHMAPRDLRDLLQLFMKLRRLGLEEEDLTSMLEVAERTEESPSQIIAAFKGKAQTEKLREKAGGLETEISDAEAELKQLDLDPKEVKHLKAIRQEMRDTGAGLWAIGDFHCAHRKLKKHETDDPNMLAHWVGHLAASIAEMCEKAGIDPDEAIEACRMFVQKGISIAEAFQECQGEVEKLEAKKKELQASVDELTTRQLLLTQEAESPSAKSDTPLAAETGDDDDDSTDDSERSPGEVDQAGDPA